MGGGSSGGPSERKLIRSRVLDVTPKGAFRLNGGLGSGTSSSNRPASSRSASSCATLWFRLAEVGVVSKSYDGTGRRRMLETAEVGGGVDGVSERGDFRRLGLVAEGGCEAEDDRMRAGLRGSTEEAVVGRLFTTLVGVDSSSSSMMEST
jgi:hypothetical protein